MKDKTLIYYNENSISYYNLTIKVNLVHIYKKITNQIPKNSYILDLGCGSGRDSLYFKQQGHNVLAIDGSNKMVKLASKLLNENVIEMKFEDFNLNKQFNCIWACASLLHIKRNYLKDFLLKISANLKEDGIIYMSFKYGNLEYTDENNRYFNCYTENTINKLISEISTLKIKEIFKTTDVMPNRFELTWLNIICGKNYI
ncbi:class I SAM-dependent methyltransferase [Clostridium tarantellae]|uniref:Methyltransferase domain-containing protein n=1 Tax=Clostridium tarantellae TaxID=39493 RepID=A0A6I1MT18_9CLOT|nr:class I SAM-dependent methyltransferase [Clostridium tarantellae]MPQ44021.1 methyltransferase domain-containing protein [Clostridium tarantellae]